jgi:hypothetical protein
VPDGIKAKDLVGIPWMVALALRADGWYLRSEITWAKVAPMPESVQDRPTNATEKIFLLSRSRTYYYDAEAVRIPLAEATIERDRTFHQLAPKNVTADVYGVKELTGNMRPGVDTKSNPSGRNLWNYWLLGPEPFPEAHFATFPSEIPRRAILAGTSERGCCPSCGAPWRRVVERTPMKVEHSARVDVLAADGYRTQTSGTMVPAPSSVTTGWQPSCTCDAGDPVPCLVLDCFSGSGTTVMTALRLNRRGLGLELSESYVALSERRIIGDAPLWNGLPS